MKRSEIDALIRDARKCFEEHGWALPPHPKWDVTDFGLGDWQRYGLVLVNLTEQPEYCEKLMFARRGMTTPAHHHLRKKEDIICRWGTLRVKLWATEGHVLVDGKPVEVALGEEVELAAGSRVTLEPGVVHEFWPVSEACIIGEVSTANDDLNDNVFRDPAVGRFSEILEDVPSAHPLISHR